MRSVRDFFSFYVHPFSHKVGYFETLSDVYDNGFALYRPTDIPLDIFVEELKFYRFPRSILIDYLKTEGTGHPYSEVILWTFKTTLTPGGIE